MAPEHEHAEREAGRQERGGRMVGDGASAGVLLRFDLSAVVGRRLRRDSGVAQALAAEGRARFRTTVRGRA